MNVWIADRAIAVAVVLASSLLAWHPLADADTLSIQGAGTGFGVVRSIGGIGAECNVGYGSCSYPTLPANTTVVLAAVPDAGSVFAGWSGACSGTGTCRITLDGDRTVTATMDARPGTNYLAVRAYSLDGIGSGWIASSPAGIDCATPSQECRMNLPSGTVVTLSASPTAGSKFAWGTDCRGTGPCQVPMDRKRFVSALFEVQSRDSLNFTALWWVPTEAGWGINLNHQGDVIFGTLFTYDRSGAPVWLVMSSGARASTVSGFMFYGDLYRTTGSPFNAVPVVSNATKVGMMSITFTGFDSAELTYFFDGQWMIKRISKQVYGSRAADCRPTRESRATATNYQDLWWNPAEPGWGINLAHQDDTLFATLFTYDETGRDLWLVMSAGRRQPDGSFSGDLYRAKGPPFNARPFTPVGPADLTRVGTMRLQFGDGDHGTLSYSYNGTPVTKPITRQVFSSPMPVCG